MENIISRSFDYPRDQARLIKFWLKYRAAADVRKSPTLWRMRLLLTSRVWAPEKDTQIWENESGQMIGFAMLWRRYQTSPYIVLDGYIHPESRTQEMARAILQWGDSRAKEIAQSHAADFLVFVTGFSQSAGAVKLLEAAGYSLVPPNPEGQDVYFSKPLDNEIPAPLLPAGYEIRKLQNVDALEAYQAISGFAKVNPQHQQELIESDEYAHFVIVDPRGELSAYCECSICRSEWESTNQRIGWIDYVETRPEQQRKGLGQAALSAGLLQLQRWGAETALLITIDTNLPAVTLYNRSGFERVEIPGDPSYQKQITGLKTGSP